MRTRDPHGYPYMFFLIFTPVGWVLAVAFHAWKVAVQVGSELRRRG
jgi:hypothetical protein